MTKRINTKKIEATKQEFEALLKTKNQRLEIGILNLFVIWILGFRIWSEATLKGHSVSLARG